MCVTIWKNQPPPSCSSFVFPGLSFRLKQPALLNVTSSRNNLLIATEAGAVKNILGIGQIFLWKAMAPFPQRSLRRCSLQPRVPSTKTSLFSNPWLCQVILPALTLGLSSGTTQNSNPEGLRHTALGRCVCVCEAQTCSQQLTQVHLAQGVAFRCLPLNSFVLILLHSQSYLKQSRGEAFHVEQAGAMPSQTLAGAETRHQGETR